MLLITAGLAAAAPPTTHGAAERVAHLERLLAVVRASDAATRGRAEAWVRALERGQCAAASERQAVECLIGAARRYCRRSGPDCPLLLDAVITNVLADRQLIPDARRYELMQGAPDPRAAVAAELRRLQGALAVDLRLRMGEADDDAELARHIDRFCLISADATNLPWQACAASLVWFLVEGGAR
jgi:hypothetical protein